MKPETSYEWRKQLMWGVVLICFGLGIFLDQMNLVEFRGMWHYSPLLLVVFGINKMIGYPTAKHFTSGLWELFIGLWIFAVFENMYGLTWGNSWPFVIIASGVTMVLEPIIRKRFAPNEEYGNEK
ncbi:LiaF transmembrane domain-containing protein [Massilia sp. TSP1-1-2]|uniref:LiaF transmembrane domain-containing protein n=1 Tax=unclassified Massilia TaxID=2609279 RepID=UPI003CF8D599